MLRSLYLGGGRWGSRRQQDPSSAASGRDRPRLQQRRAPGTEPPPALPDPPGRLLDDEQGPQRQEQVQLLPARRAL